VPNGSTIVVNRNTRRRDNIFHMAPSIKNVRSLVVRTISLLVIVISMVHTFQLRSSALTSRIMGGICRNKDVSLASSTSTTAAVAEAPFDELMPFVSEHINPSDQILFVGAKTDMSLKLAKNGYGVKKTGFLLVVDSDNTAIEELKGLAMSDPELASLCNEKKLTFVCTDLTDMKSVCKQSFVDAIVDYGGLDSLHGAPTGKEGVLKCIDQLQKSVRLGNVLVCLSKLDKETFCGPFDERFGWVQELDGDPGEISAWYRGKTNIKATKSNFSELGLKMYVYTNTDNC
jgi:hypothetical protein